MLQKIAVLNFKCKGRQHTILEKSLKNLCINVQFLSLQISENVNSFIGIFQKFFLSSGTPILWNTAKCCFCNFTSLIKRALHQHLYGFCTPDWQKYTCWHFIYYKQWKLTICINKLTIALSQSLFKLFIKNWEKHFPEIYNLKHPITKLWTILEKCNICSNAVNWECIRSYAC